MKYTIYGFDQKILVELGLNSNEALILRWFVDFNSSGRMETVYDGKKQYFWVKYKAVIEDLPILGINSKQVISRHFKKMVDCGLMEFYLKKSGGTFSCYRLNKKIYSTLLYWNREVDQKVQPSDQKVEPPSDQKVEPPSDQKVQTKDSSTNINYKTNKDYNNIHNDKQSLSTRIKIIFDEYYESIYNEKFSWGDKGSRYGKEIRDIISNSGNYNDNEKLELIKNKMIILRYFVETEPKFWKFNYSNLANKWNELVMPYDPDVDRYKIIIEKWNILTGQEQELTPAIMSLMSVAKIKHSLEILTKAILGKAVNKYDIENNNRNLAILLQDKNSQISTYMGKYDEGLRDEVHRKLKSNIKSGSPFPAIEADSDYDELMGYDWLQHGLPYLSKYVIGQSGYERVKSGEDVKNIIKEIHSRKLKEMIGGLQK